MFLSHTARLILQLQYKFVRQSRTWPIHLSLETRIFCLLSYKPWSDNHVLSRSHAQSRLVKNHQVLITFPSFSGSLLLIWFQMELKISSSLGATYLLHLPLTPFGPLMFPKHMSVLLFVIHLPPPDYGMSTSSLDFFNSYRLSSVFLFICCIYVVCLLQTSITMLLYWGEFQCLQPQLSSALFCHLDREARNPVVHCDQHYFN